MGLDFDCISGQTPLDEEEKEALLIPTIATRGELDEYEQQNIEEAIQWLLARNFKTDILLTEQIIKEVHKRMFGKVWRWSGEIRKKEKNIGIDKHRISEQLKNLLDDTAYHIANRAFPPDEIAVRFKHRLVSIHCFPNGNGRHSRLMADILIDKIFHQPVFTWGAGIPARQGDARTAYLAAIRTADAGDIKPLLAFARS